MNISEKINRCEIEYSKCFCEINEQKNFIRFHDELIPDMYYHNFTRINSINDDFMLVQLIESEINYSKNKGKKYCLIRCNVPINKSVITNLNYKPEISISGYYVLNIQNISKLNKAIDGSVLKINSDEMVEDLLALDLEHDEENLGKDFCTRRVYRRKEVYLSNQGVDSYIYYHNNKAIGNCDLFIYNRVAKIEDFAILPKNQRKGYGTAMLKYMIEIAVERGVNIIYLETDEDDTAKEMYKKCGFYKLSDFTDLTFNF